MVDHVLLGLGDVLQVDDDDVLKVRYSIMLKQFHLNLKNQNFATGQEMSYKSNLDHFRNLLKCILTILNFLLPFCYILNGSAHLRNMIFLIDS